MVRAGDNNELIPLWREKGVVSIGWAELGNPRQFKERGDLIQKAHDVYILERPASRIAWASQLWRFCHEIKPKDRVVTYAKDKREYMVGTVTEPHQFNEMIISDRYPNVVFVSWEERNIPRDSLSQGAKNSLGSILTVFRIDDWGEELERLLQGDKMERANGMEEEWFIDDLEQRAKTMIADKVDQLDPWDMQELVAGLLRAMGYEANVSKKGPDGGVDILAHRDAFGFEKPIIKVQVKHRKSTSSAPEIQQLLGAHPIDANGLFVSTGGFTAQAKAIARQHHVKLLDLEELVDMVVQWYDQMPNETKALLSLRKIYVPE